jgi:hypothetical protein
VDLQGVLGLEGELARFAEQVGILLDIRRAALPLAVVSELPLSFPLVFARGPVVRVKPILLAATALR